MSTALQRKDLYSVALNRLESDLGGRGPLVDLLSLAPLTTQTRYLLMLLTDRDHGHKSLGDLCALGDVTPGELLKVIEEGQLLSLRVRAMQHAVEEAPKVVAHVLRQAQPHYEECDTCLGTGHTVQYNKDGTTTNLLCKTCRGTKQVLKQPSLGRQKLALEIARVTQPKGQQINVGIKNVPGGQPSTFRIDDFQRMSEIMDAPSTVQEPIQDGDVSEQS